MERKSNNCDSKSKDTKCFNCEKFGHISKDCPWKKGESNNIRLDEYDDDIMMKIIKIGDETTNALLDTGSKFNVIQKSIFREFEKSSPDCTLTKSNFYLSGFDHNIHDMTGHYNPSVRIIDLVSYITYVVCVNFIHK